MNRHETNRRGKCSYFEDFRPGNRYRFQGREWSAVTGLVNFRARWYDPATGRWISKDPIGLSGGLNLYAFCGNDPVNCNDPYGLSAWGDFWGKVQDEHDKIWCESYDGPVMDVAESLSVLFLANAAIGLAQDIGAKGLEALADSEIAAGKLAGANTSGSILQKISAANKGANIARTTTMLKGVMGAACKGAGMASVAATIYHGASHASAYGAAVIITAMGWNK